MERSGGASLLGQDRPVESTPALEAIWTKLGVCLDLRSFRLGESIYVNDWWLLQDFGDFFENFI